MVNIKIIGGYLWKMLDKVKPYSAFCPFLRSIILILSNNIYFYSVILNNNIITLINILSKTFNKYH